MVRSPRAKRGRLEPWPHKDSQTCAQSYLLAGAADGGLHLLDGFVERGDVAPLAFALAGDGAHRTRGAEHLAARVAEGVPDQRLLLVVGGALAHDLLELAHRGLEVLAGDRDRLADVPHHVVAILVGPRRGAGCEEPDQRGRRHR